MGVGATAWASAAGAVRRRARRALRRDCLGRDTPDSRGGAGGGGWEGAGLFHPARGRAGGVVGGEAGRAGRTSSYYLDKYLFSTRPDVLRQLAALFGQRIAGFWAGGARVDRIAGAELGGVPLVTATSLEIGLPCLFVRGKKKDYGTSKQ